MSRQKGRCPFQNCARLFAILGVGLLFLVDQWTKKIAVAFLKDADYGVTPYLNLHLQYNPGAAFSLLGAGHLWQIGILFFLSTLAIGVLSMLLYRASKTVLLLRLGMICILGGALGNWWDRLLWGGVVDFIDLHWGDWHFPVFNCADIAITVGAICVFIHSFMCKNTCK